MAAILNPLEILHTNSRKVACDGSKDSQGNNMGHPLVYLNMGKNDSVVCPYCSKCFVIQKSVSKKFGEKND